MENRQPTYPGRVILTPVPGQANTYDMVRADEPTVEGTPLNKATLLQDATCRQYGLQNTVVPDDILKILSKSLLYNNGNLSLTNGSEIELSDFAFTVGTYTGNGSSSRNISLGFSPSAVLISQYGTGFAYYEYGSNNIYYIYGAFAIKNSPAIDIEQEETACSINSNGFTVYQRSTNPKACLLNVNRSIYNYIAFR